MKKIFVFVCILFVLSSRQVSAKDQHALILNFAQMNEMEWTAPEDKWQAEVKPTIEEQIKVMRETLDPRFREDDGGVVLGWSTLLEYMNFPMDTPGPSSPYVVKTRRILEIAKDLDFPVFLPLNGFQWWDELPELYNWWDSDGTHTDQKFFARQDDPADFKARFIAGYDPDNEENVLWQSRRTPMKLNVRNWGGGGFFLAPPPNLQSPVYLAVQHDRLRAIVTELMKDKHDDLFLGVSIGTEVSLNASVTPADEFKSYGGTDKVEIVQKYLEDNARLITRLGIGKEQIYTHVLGEQDKTDPHYGGVAESAFNLYSNPGVSLYGYASDPTGSAEWMQSLSKVGNPDWGILEYNAGDSPTDWQRGLSEATKNASLTVIYNWDGLSPNAIPAIKSILSTPLKIENCKIENLSEHIQRGLVARLGNPEVTDAPLPHGIYVKFTETTCDDGKTEYSQPEKFYVPVTLPPDTTPRWVQWTLEHLLQ